MKYRVCLSGAPTPGGPPGMPPMTSRAYACTFTAGGFCASQLLLTPMRRPISRNAPRGSRRRTASRAEGMAFSCGNSSRQLEPSAEVANARPASALLTIAVPAFSDYARTPGRVKRAVTGVEREVAFSAGSLTFGYHARNVLDSDRLCHRGA